jgi:hypothetical protein
VVAVSASFPLAALDAGDPVSNHELRKFLALDQKPTAKAEGGERVVFTIGARKMEAKVTYSGTPPRGSARFELTFTGLGYTPPKLLFLKVKDTLEVEVSSELIPVSLSEKSG